ncbi:hypothetical protein [Streptomyces sp. R41]|uniref:Uncharacterized protein n=1 Tax=Streptomyces sp. R41 TaxID=3238632 RepID=A0AB39RBP7_9ACTN
MDRPVVREHTSLPAVREPKHAPGVHRPDVREVREVVVREPKG